MKLHKYQIIARNWILKNPKCGLFLEMGLGKTIITLSALARLRAGSSWRALVIAPKRVAEHVWAAEAKKWEAPMTVSVIKGTPAQRKEALKKKADLYVISINLLNDIVKEKFDVVVLDELSLYKSSGTQRFRTAKKITKNADRVIGLTGTPTPNGMVELWSEMFLIDEGERLGKYKQTYLNKYFYVKRELFNGRVKLYEVKKDGSKERIMEDISDICLSMKSCDHLDMPKLVENTIPVAMSDSEKKQYKDISKKHMIGDLLLDNFMGAFAKCMQYCSGFTYGDKGEVSEHHTHKLEVLKETVEAINSNVLIAYWFIEDLIRIKKLYPEARVLKEAKDFEDWNKGNIAVGLLHPRSGGHGLNLQQGATHIIWFNPGWSLELRQQFNARLYRQGQEFPVHIHTLVMQDTLEETMIDCLVRKDITQAFVMEKLKENLYEKLT